MKKIKLSTEVKLDANYPSIDYSNSLVFSGSCFSENIHQKLLNARFSSLSNPFGICYNPISLHKQFDFINTDESFDSSTIITEGDYHFNYLFSRAFCLNYDSKEELQEAVKKIKLNSKKYFEKTEIVFVTYGTSWVYTNNENGDIVNNCHKQDAKKFRKRLLSVNEIVASFKKIEPILKGKKVVFTVSPVRHQKDGLRNNQISKSILHLAIEEIIKSSDNYFYFPSYEVVMDELRDYRYFKSDLLHPNELAIDILWQKFQLAFFKPEIIEIVKNAESIQRSLNHRVMKKGSQEEEKFKESLQEKIANLESKVALPFKLD